MQKCKKCKKVKNANDFYIGNKHVCKKCLIKRTVLWMKNNPKKCSIYKAKEKAKRANPEYKKKQYEYYRRWYATGGMKRAKNYTLIIRLWQKLNPEKCQAYHLVQIALKSGKLKKPKNCTKCGEKKKLLGHHDDYKYPLRVRWMCYSCHKKLIH